MSQSRLATVLGDDLLTLPAGDVAVLRPPATYDLSPIPSAQVKVSHGFRPDAEFWRAAGLDVTPDPAPAAAAIVVVPRSKALARSMIAQAARLAGLVIVDGQKTEGVDSLFREVRARMGDVPSVTKAHGRLFWFDAAAEVFDDWIAPPPRPGPDGFHTQAGAFSEQAVDRGSALLAAAFPSAMPARIVDIGAGWGYLAQALLGRAGVQSVDLIEAERLALDCARLNVTDPRATFHWADATRHMPARGYDGAVMNPPFHSGRAADPALGLAFIDAAARMLAGHGQLWLVANRHLPYEAALREKFRNVDEIGGDAAFKLFHSTRPRR